MCLAYPGKIISIEGQKATIDFDGIEKDANISMVNAKVGDYVIVHAGFAIQILSDKDAMEILKEYENADEKYRKNSEKN